MPKGTLAQVLAYLRLESVQFIGLSTLVLFLLIGLGTIALSFAERNEAAAQLDESREVLASLEGRLPAEGAQFHRVPVRFAPVEAFITAATPGLAAAQLQSHVAQVASLHNTQILSVGPDSAAEDRPADAARVHVTLVTSLERLQAFLYDIESGTPYIFVEALIIQRQDGSSNEQSGEPPLRAMLTLRALVRREAS